MEQWWYLEGGQQTGPVGADVIWQQLRAGRLDASSLVWQEGMPQWQPLESVPGLHSLQQMQAPQNPGETGRTTSPGQRIILGLALIVTGVFALGLGIWVIQGFFSGHGAPQENPAPSVAASLDQAASPANIPVATPAAKPVPASNPPDSASTQQRHADAQEISQTWRNPVSGKASIVSAEWLAEDLTRRNPKAILVHSFSQEKSRIRVILTAEKVFAMNSLREVGTAFMAAKARDYEFSGSEQYYLSNNVTFWHMNARSRARANTQVSVDITIKGKYAWIMTSMMPENADSRLSSKVYGLNNELWDTIL